MTEQIASQRCLPTQCPITAASSTTPSMPQHWQARLLWRLLNNLQAGSLRLTTPEGHTYWFGTHHAASNTAATPPAHHLQLHDWQVVNEVLRAGDIGFAECWIAGRWETDDLTGLLRLLIRNRCALEPMIYGRWWQMFWQRLQHWFNRNTKAQARKNIAAHYDLGNAFYALWLDASMTYSSALFTDSAHTEHATPAENLQAAQTRKYQRLFDELQLDNTAATPASVLEIGCGWGGFAELVAQRSTAQLTGLTLSKEQLAYATERLAKQGYAARTQLKLQDYRDETNQYDAIASIEMFEAVGEAYWPSYFATLKRCLKPNGRACVQTIVIDHQLFARYRRNTDFIQQYIFPGGMLPSVPTFIAAAEQAGLRVIHQFAFGQDYARTLALWRTAFLEQLASVRSQGFDERFIRIWLFYLAYCEAGFAEENTDVIQFTLAHA